MKSIVKFLASGVFAASFTLAAHATAISGSIAGNDNNAAYNNATGLLTFGNPGSVSGTPVGLGGYFHDLDTMTFYAGPGPGGSFFYSTTTGGTLTLPGSTATSGGAEVFSVTDGGETLAFYVTSDTTAYNPSDNTSLVLNGTGYFTETGTVAYTTTASTFHLSGTQSGGTFSFGGSATTAPTPEPNSLMLLGTGLVSAAGMVIRKRRSIV